MSEYKLSYGRYNHAPDFEKCAYEVPIQGVWSGYKQCSKTRGHGPNESYCKIHDPNRIEAKKKAKARQHDIEYNQRLKLTFGPVFFRKLEEIAAGHNDPRGLANDTINEFNNMLREIK